MATKQQLGMLTSSELSSTITACTWLTGVQIHEREIIESLVDARLRSLLIELTDEYEQRERLAKEARQAATDSPVDQQR
jgi:hypothetical protein